MWCAVTVVRHRKPTTVASSGPEAEALDETQNRFPAGPCLTAIREHHRKLREVAADLVATVGRTPATTHFDT